MSCLFFSELWERFSYYGMRAILILFMTAAVAEGGMGLGTAPAGAIYGLYTAAVYLFALPGGFIADRLIGQRNAIWYGGIIIATGHFTMAMPGFGILPENIGFFCGLVLIALGTGLLKPNISTVVGELYPEGGAKRDQAFSIFYMGINIGAFLGPIICGFLAESPTFGWHWGFGAAGVGMVLGLIFYRTMGHSMGEAGLYPAVTDDPNIGRYWMLIWAFVGILALVGFLAFRGVIELDPQVLAGNAGLVIVGLAALFFTYVLVFGGLDRVGKQHTIVIALLFVGAAVFWSGFEQAGSSLNIFAKTYTNRMLFGWEVPASWLQAVNPLMIIALAPVFGWLWVKLAVKNLDPSIPLKFAFGLVLLGAGFYVMVLASEFAAQGQLAGMQWLILTYFLHTSGELCLSPVGLSSVTKLAPKKYAAQMMGTWFMGAALGNLVAGLLGGEAVETAEQMPDAFMTIVITTVGAGILFALFSPAIRRLIHLEPKQIKEPPPPDPRLDPEVAKGS